MTGVGQVAGQLKSAFDGQAQKQGRCGWDDSVCRDDAGDGGVADQRAGSAGFRRRR